MKERYYSLDVFRGATVALMILVNNPGSWAHIYSPFEHATWHGCTPTDLVFPFFLFAVGNAIAFVMPRMQERGTGYFFQKILKRSALIFAIGLALHWAPFVQWKGEELGAKKWENVRIFGVLQRIAICYLFASIIIYTFRTKTVVAISALMLLGYWFICHFLGNSNDPYTLQSFFGTRIDKAILGESHMYKGEGVAFDPEGIASTFGAIVQVIVGYFAGKFIRERGKGWDTLAQIFIFGAVLIFVGFAWDMALPINKKIWTSSFVLYTSGLALMVLGMLIYLLEFKNAAGAWSKFFDIFGKNPLFIFFMSGFLPRVIALIRWTDHLNEAGKPVYTSFFPWLYLHVCKPVSSNLKVGSLLYALVILFFYWALAYFLNKRKIYIKV